MSRIAIATCRGDNIDIDAPVLTAALDRAGLDSELLVWDDPSVDWNAYDLVVIRSTWDYAPQRDRFLAWAQGIARLHNPYDVIVSSTDKHYLADLAARDVPVVPSVFCEIGDTPLFPEGDFVVKPAIGAGSIDADRYRSDEHERALAHVTDLHARGRSVLVQPYVASVDDRGELALVFIDGVFSHAMRKGAMLNTPADERDFLFRREQMSRTEAPLDAIALASELVAEVGQLLYTRVDLVMGERGWQLMEFEMVEPSLFLTFAPEAADALAAAISRRL